MIEWSTNHTFVMKQLELLGFMLTADQSICTASLHTAAHATQNCGTSSAGILDVRSLLEKFSSRFHW